MEINIETCLLSYTGLVLLLLIRVSVYLLLAVGLTRVCQWSLLGAMRSAILSISFEVLLAFLVLTLMILWHSIVVDSVCNVWLSIVDVTLLMCLLGELNRTPFDLRESESELTSGYNTELSSVPFALYFLGEYSSILFFTCLLALLNLGVTVCTPIIVIVTLFCVISTRRHYPRIRFDMVISVY